MERRNFQVSVLGMIGLVACVAMNVWLFRVSMLLGIIGINVSKHLAVAYVCQVIGVNRRPSPAPAPVPPPPAWRAIGGRPAGPEGL